ncbi:MAG: hypothetical protein A2491_12415 [Bacteroidetes bacterium RIFOXYC12_FULL_35_7]|nr:MAG: hypothetical protein A2491_12415 [Bacteroidetes bacterium RIFOXYC12_FULL_35_7]
MNSFSAGKAKLKGPATKGHLKVSFFWFFYADYIIIYIDDEYKTAVVTSSTDKYLWILSREKSVEISVKEKLISIASEMDFDTEKLIWVKHR